MIAKIKTSSSRKSAEKVTALATAKAVEAERTVAAAAAEQYLEALSARLRSGDDTVSASDMEAAQGEVKRWDLLVPAARRAVARALLLEPSTDVTLANALAPSVEAALGVSVTVSTTLPTGPAQPVPSAVIVQRRPTAQDVHRGLVAGEVQVLYFRERLHREADLRRLEDAARALHIDVSASARGEFTQGGVTAETIGLAISRASLSVPVIVSDMSGQQWPLDHLRQALAGIISSGMYKGHEHPEAGIITNSSGDGGSLRRLVQVDGDQFRTVSDDRDGSGVRHLRVEVMLSIYPRAGCDWSAGEIARRVRDSVEKLDGMHFDALGKVVSVSLVLQPMPKSARGSEALVRLDFVSQAPQGA